jgi:hypothetical protein
MNSNKDPFIGFHPLPNTSETVTIPLTPGRNSLKLEVKGLNDKGNTAKDMDELTFKVP